MLTHCVFFWAKEGLTDADRRDFQQGLRSLVPIPHLVEGSVGAPAAFTRPNVDSSYTFALVLKFADVAAHDAYQVDPAHKAFIARCAPYWSKVVVYDVVT